MISMPVYLIPDLTKILYKLPPMSINAHKRRVSEDLLTRGLVMQPKCSSSSSSSSSSSTSAKLKALFLNLITDIAKKKNLITDIPKKKKLITDSLHRLLRSLSRAKSIIKDISKLNKKRLFMMMFHPTKSSLNHCSVFVRSSSVVFPFTEPFRFSLHGREDEDTHDRYLEWLEERIDENNNINADHSVGDLDVGDDDIDRLADIFIASCHERFLLEKVESYRRFQEMLSRSL